jgi:hypothetical protein
MAPAQPRRAVHLRVSTKQPVERILHVVTLNAIGVQDSLAGVGILRKRRSGVAFCGRPDSAARSSCAHARVRHRDPTTVRADSKECRIGAPLFAGDGDGDNRADVIELEGHLNFSMRLVRMWLRVSQPLPTPGSERKPTRRPLHRLVGSQGSAIASNSATAADRRLAGKFVRWSIPSETATSSAWLLFAGIRQSWVCGCLSDNGEVRLTTTIRQVVARPRARLDLELTIAKPGGELNYVIVNEGDSPLLFGAGYGFERRKAVRWRSRRTGMVFAAWGKRLAPGMSSTSMSAHVPADFEPGRYRLITSLTLLHPDGSPVRSSEGTKQIRVLRKFALAARASADRRAEGESAFR